MRSVSNKDAIRLWHTLIGGHRQASVIRLQCNVSVLEATAIEQGRDGGSFSLRETRFIGHWAV